MENCLFCKIASGEVPASKIFDEGGYVAFLDLFPANKGHVLVIPKEHFERVEGLPSAQAQGLILAVQRVANALVKSLGCPAVNILANSGKEAGQIIPHAHMHVIPRFEKDGLFIKWPRNVYGQGEMDQFAAKIAGALAIQ